MEGRTLKVIVAICMMLAAFLVIVTCVWKLIKASSLHINT
jgi:hypothetical protein